MSDLFPWFCDLTREYAKDLTFASAAASEEVLFTAGNPAHASVQCVPDKFAVQLPHGDQTKGAANAQPTGLASGGEVDLRHSEASPLHLSRGIDIQSSAAQEGQ